MIKDHIKEILLKTVLAILGAGVLASGAAIAYYMAGYSNDRKENDYIKDVAYKKVITGENEAFEEKASFSREETSKDIAAPSIDFEALKEINSDTAGWITACGGAIDGPVVSAFDNDYYLEHRFDKSEGSAGCFFADVNGGPAFSGPLTVIYGHNRKDGSMFHPLLDYKSEDHYKSFPDFTVSTEEGTAVYKIFSAYYGDYSRIFDSSVNAALTGGDDKALRDLFEEAMSRSILDPSGNEEESYVRDLFENAIAEQDVSIVMLCTCEYSGEDNRMVVFGIRE